MIKLYLLTCLLLSSIATSAQFERLSAAVNYHSVTHEVVDSTQYMYPGGQVACYDSLLGIYLFDTAYTYSPQGTLKAITLQQHDAAGRLIYYQIDGLSGTTWYTNNYSIRCEYNAAGQLGHIYYRYNPHDSVAFGYSYNAKGQMTQMTFERWDANSGKWQPEYIDRYSYNASDSIAFIYHFEAHADGTEDSLSRRIAIYTPGMKAERTENKTGTMWQTVETSVTQYNNQNKPVEQEWYWKKIIDGGLEPRNRTRYYYNDYNFADSIIEQIFTANTYKDEYRTYYAYDYFRKTITTNKYRLNWQTGTYEPYVFIRHYYEEIPPLPDTPDAKLTFTVYPIPTSGVLYADITGSTPTYAMLRITNASGQAIKTVLLPPLPIKHMPLEIPQLAAGLYTITLYAGGEVWTEKAIVQ